MDPRVRHARRALWAFRLIFYPAALLVLVGLLHGPAEPPIEPGTVSFHGRTSQHEIIRLAVVDGRSRSFYTTLRSVCANGSEVPFRWAQTDAGPPLFKVERNRLTAKNLATRKWSNGSLGSVALELRARLDGDALNGRMYIIDRQAAYECKSGWVTFTAQR